MNGKRIEARARCGDILLTLDGSEGVLFLAHLYHEAGPIAALRPRGKAGGSFAIDLNNDMAGARLAARGSISQPTPIRAWTLRLAPVFPPPVPRASR